MDNVGMLAGNRVIKIDTAKAEYLFGLNQERAFNSGVVLVHKFKFNYRDASLSFDFFHTQFQQQVVIDWETPGEVQFYNLTGRSFSNNAQVELNISPVKRMEFRAAYRWLEAITNYGGEEKMRPLVAKHRAFFNLAYETKATDKGAKWVFDITARWLGPQRLAYSSHQEHGEQQPKTAPDYWIINAQVAFHFSHNLEFYIGGENLGNFTIMHPIAYAHDPANDLFDASQIWGPVFGRMSYAGLRWRIGK
jgi:outer membrane receptor for ferrienterochelin and colicin